MTHATRILRAYPRPLDVAMRQSFGIAGGAQEHAHNVLFTVELEGGVRGYGEAAPFPAFNGETQAGALAALDQAAGVLPGWDARDGTDIAEHVDFADVASARCAVETAVLDACARAEGRSLRAYFGGAEEQLVSDVTIVTGSVTEAERDARAHAAFRTLKIKVGGSSVDHDIARVLAVRAARPDAELLLDANGGLTFDEALSLAEELARRDAKPALFEQPIAPGAPDEWAALAELRRRAGVRLALDESVTCEQDVAEAVRHGAADAVNVKIMKSGVFEAVRIARAAAAAGIDRMIGGLVETRLAMGMSACIAAGLGGFRIVDLDTPLFLATDPFEGGYVYDGDRLDLRPIALGHGCTPARRS